MLQIIFVTAALVLSGLDSPCLSFCVSFKNIKMSGFFFLEEKASIYGTTWSAPRVHRLQQLFSDAVRDKCPHCVNEETVAISHCTTIHAVSLMRLGKYMACPQPLPTPVLLADIINQSWHPFPLRLDSALPSSARQPLLIIIDA